jgi:ribonucleoside-diphosphate reductase alpha chain
MSILLLENFKELGYDQETLTELEQVQKQYSSPYDLDLLFEKVRSFVSPSMDSAKLLDVLIRASLELTTATSPRWEYISARFLTLKIRYEIEKQDTENKISSFYDKVFTYTNQGLYGDYLLKHYTEEEINQMATFIQPSRDQLLNYSGLSLLYKRYLLRTFDNVVVESPQEMFLGIAMHLAMSEKNNRLSFVKDVYDILSQLKVTMATPTLSNARKPHYQLSSCFIDAVDDSLNGIYKSIDNFAKVSKSGGGMGLYFGKVRASGSDIRGFKGVAGGVIRWIKLANDTAVAVDQLGVRQGAVAVYLDAWHKDLPEFLQLRTNNGDDRSKAHDVFPGICYPDLFWKMVKEDLNATWYLMCPHEIKTIKGYSLEDYYGSEWEKRYLECTQDARISKREICLKDLMRLIIKSATETGTPFTFNRDIVNASNPNKHAGIIYSSNLCTEIMQNMRPIRQLEPEIVEIDGETVVVERSIPGDFVVCNLASLVLGHIDTSDEAEMRHIIHTVVRALDNVIDHNAYPLTYARVTNQRYRAIGLGVSGYHHLLVNKGLRWESEEHLTFVDALFEKINYYAIEASMEIAKEKGAYPLFEGSDWETGAYFKTRGYTSSSWAHLASKVAENGLRNAYLLAIAPTSSTSILVGTTAGIDPIMHKYFLEEKKNHILPRVAPNLSPETFWLYKSAHTIDQKWSIKAAGVRQRHIDQSQSLNLYITTDYSMRQVLNLFLQAWEDGVKTLYYIRSKSLEVEACESCSS